MAGLISDNGGHVKPSNVGTSTPQHTSVGSGSRPVPSKHKIESGSAADPHTQGREPTKDPGWLK